MSCKVLFNWETKINGEGFHGHLNYCVEVVESNYHSLDEYLLGSTNNCNYYY